MIQHCQVGYFGFSRGTLADLITVDRSIFLSDTRVALDPKVVAPYSQDKLNADRLWKLSEDLVDQKFEY